jgi:hypothetical protein
VVKKDALLRRANKKKEKKKKKHCLLFAPLAARPIFVSPSFPRAWEAKFFLTFSLHFTFSLHHSTTHNKKHFN